MKSKHLEQLKRGRAAIFSLYGVLGAKIYDDLTDMIKDRGWEESLPTLKAISVAVMQFVAGNPPSGPLAPYRATTDGLPAILGDAIPGLRDRDAKTVQMVLTILKIRDLSTYWPKPDLSPITEESRFDFSSEESSKLFEATRKALACLNIKISRRRTNFKKFHHTSKMGPLGASIRWALTDMMEPSFGPIMDSICALSGIMASKLGC